MLSVITLRLKLAGIDVELVPHVEFKQRARAARAVVRSGEFTPYSNVLLYSGAAFSNVFALA